MVKILFGKPVADKIFNDLSYRSKNLHAVGITPTLAVVLVGKDAASRVYVATKQKVAHKLGIDFLLYHLPETISFDELSRLLVDLHLDGSVHGIIVQLPLPTSIEIEKLVPFIDPAKDVDHFNGASTYPAPTPNAILKLLDAYGISIKNKKIGIIGCGFLVGKPLQEKLKKLGAKVESYELDTKDVSGRARKTDILITATGQPKLVDDSFTNKTQVIVDVGNARDTQSNKVVGDVDFDAVRNKVAAITPTIGGVGPITVALLMQNVIIAAEKQQL
jgi:methylenetetrahydrofolate dehydrogenase (NADP+)/methenyltetrahydrofolate cyclohydrolase